jgi:UDPglucose--hexose-1-phosphate uridylyltransferase
MPELRKDPIIGRWVIIATERAKRPDDFRPVEEGPAEGECPFCEGHENQTTAEITAIRNNSTRPNTPGWEVRVVPSIKPMLKIEGNLDRRGKSIYDIMNGIGAHEIVIEAPKHIANMADLEVSQIEKVINTYISRIDDLEKDHRFKYVLAFKNFGWSAGGGRISHSRSQLIATPVTPKRIKEKLAGSRRYFEYHERCVFCDMIKQEMSSGDRIICDVDGFVAIAPFASRFPFEAWILPKKHCPDFTRLEPQQRKDLAATIKCLLQKLKVGLNNPSYNYIINTAPFRRLKAGYWKTIDEDYHWHIEVMPRLTRVAGFEWGTGFYICPLPPESAAKFLREVKV